MDKSNPSEEDLFRMYQNRWKELKEHADYWMPAWRELNEFVRPWSGRFLNSDEDLPGIRRGEFVFNSVVFNAVETAASGLHGGLTSPSRPWFELAHPDKRIMEDSDSKTWIHRLQENQRAILARTNFYAEIQRLYAEGVAYGTGVMMMERDITSVVRYKSLTCGEYFIDASKSTRVDTLYRKFCMNAQQIEAEYGTDNISSSVKSALKSKDLKQRFYIIQAIQPWGTFDGKGSDDYEYESAHFEEGTTTGKFLRKSGYAKKPFVCVRWNTIGDDVYGYGPGNMCIADVRQLQNMERNYTNATNWAANPGLIVPHEWWQRFRREEVRPGAIIAVQNQNDPIHQFRKLLDINFDFANLRVRIQDIEARIRSVFYNDLFRMVSNRDREMSATEIVQLVEEKSIMLGPVLEAFHAEIFNPVLEHLYSVMVEMDLIDPAPDILADQQLEVQYVSLLAQAQKQAGLSSLTTFLDIASRVAAVFQEAALKVNGDELIDTLALHAPVNPEIVRSDKEVEGIRRQQAQQAQQAQMAANLPAVAGAAKDLAQAQPTPENGLGMAMGMGQ